MPVSCMLVPTPGAEQLRSPASSRERTEKLIVLVSICMWKNYGQPASVFFYARPLLCPFIIAPASLPSWPVMIPCMYFSPVVIQLNEQLSPIIKGTPFLLQVILLTFLYAVYICFSPKKTYQKNQIKDCYALAAQSIYSKNRERSTLERFFKLCDEKICQPDTAR